MRRFALASALVASFLVAGCDEDQKKDAGDKAAPKPVAERKEEKPVEPTKPPPAAPEKLDQVRAAATAPADGSDPGRVTFDGDKPHDGKTATRGTVFAGSGNLYAKPKVDYTAPATGNTLTLKEPPAPAGAGKPRRTSPTAAAPGKTATIASATTSGGELRDAVSDKNSSLAGSRGSCPPDMSKVEGYCVDKYEGSLTESGKPWPAHDKLDPAKNYKAVSQAGRNPQAYISGDQAAAACANSGKRLCTMKEWVKACQGPMRTQFPYGAQYEPGACNEFDHKDHSGHRSAMHRLFGDNASFSYIPMNDPRIDQMPETVAPSGSFSKCTNGYGVYDMVGNVHEWVSDKAGGKGMFKGGYFEDTHLNGDGCRYTTTAHEPSYHDYSTGFRCCADPS